MTRIKEERRGEIILYKSKQGPQVEALLENETIWATLNQIADLFDRDKSVISRHIKEIYKQGELSARTTVAKNATVQLEGEREIKRVITYYNLDVILSVGYRVNSKRATKFRIWATKTLKDFLVRGYAVNEKRLIEAKEKFTQLQQTIAFLKDKSTKELLTGQGGEILSLLASYAKTLTILDEYDKGTLREARGAKGTFVLTYEESKRVIAEVKRRLAGKNEAGELFGNEKDESFAGVIRGLYQTFGGQELYKTLESKAAHLLYLIIKDHSFSDGNKRSASFLFVYFLDKNNALYRDGGEKKINDNALASLALLVAESDPKEKDQMIALITQLLQ